MSNVIMFKKKSEKVIVQVQRPLPDIFFLAFEKEAAKERDEKETQKKEVVNE